MTATERPIIMSADSVRAILDGRKTMTRRVVKPQPEPLLGDPSTVVWPHHHNRSVYGSYSAMAIFMARHSPYPIGSRLWVRERWRIGAWNENTACVAIDYSDGFCRREWLSVPDPTGDGQYFSDLWVACTEEALAAGVPEDSDGQFHWEPGQSPCSWRSPIFMPRWASRITLQVTGVRAERLQEITIDDLIAEGWDARTSEPWLGGTAGEDARAWYAALWNRLNAKRGYPWSANPWVWVVEFRRVA